MYNIKKNKNPPAHLLSIDPEESSAVRQLYTILFVKNHPEHSRVNLERVCGYAKCGASGTSEINF